MSDTTASTDLGAGAGLLTSQVSPSQGSGGADWLVRAERIAAEELADMPTADAAAFTARLREWWPDLWGGFEVPYAGHPARDAQLEAVVRSLAAHWRARPTDLRRLDDERIARPDWFQAADMIGYVFYVDRFAGTLRGVEDHIDYLEELGARYIHLMPLLKTRPGDNDGGYAVTDFGAVEPRLGTIDDLEHLARRLRERGMSTCIDLVVNHTAAEHPWAMAAAAGDPTFAELYRTYPDRRIPNQFERTLPEVFPDFAPGNFTRLPDGRWVWTTFNSWQWDLNWSNPRLFALILDALLELANRGVDVFRLDAVAFMWKRLGTNCQNQPEVHQLLRALRACARIAAPAVIFKAEAIVGPDDLVPYLGVGPLAGRECDMVYHNSVMVQFWSALATRDTRLMTHVLGDFPHKPVATAWGTYVRCHDDIGWAVTEDDAEAVGWTGPEHRAFLSAFYDGSFPGSFARGVVFQHYPATNDSRVCGTCASLAGLETALEAGDPLSTDRAIERILLGHAIILAWDGIPLLYMGDEIGLRNDWSFEREPDHASDNRWVHRPRMNWAAAARRHDPTTVEGRLFAGFRHLIDVRRGLPQLHVATPLEVVDAGDRALFAFVRDHPDGRLLAVFNLTEWQRTIPGSLLEEAGLPVAVDALDPTTRVRSSKKTVLPPYAARWFVAPPQAHGVKASARNGTRPGQRRS